MVLGLFLTLLAGMGRRAILRAGPDERPSALGRGAGRRRRLRAAARAAARWRPQRRRPPSTPRCPRRARVVLVDLPLPADDGEYWIDPTYMYYSTFHWARLLNGYSGFSPSWYPRLQRRLARVPVRRVDRRVPRARRRVRRAARGVLSSRAVSRRRRRLDGRTDVLARRHSIRRPPGSIACTVCGLSNIADSLLGYPARTHGGRETDVHGTPPDQSQAHRPRLRERHPTSRDRDRRAPVSTTCRATRSASSRTTHRPWSTASSRRSARPATSRCRRGTPASTLPLAQALTEVYNLNTPSRRLLELLCVARRDRAGAAPREGQRRAAQEVPQRMERSARRPRRPRRRTRTSGSRRLSSSRTCGRAFPGCIRSRRASRRILRQVDLLVVAVRYTIRGRTREGVCSDVARRWVADALARFRCTSRISRSTSRCRPAWTCR